MTRSSSFAINPSPPTISGQRSTSFTLPGGLSTAGARSSSFGFASMVNLPALIAEAKLFSYAGNGTYAGGQTLPDESGHHADGVLGQTSGVEATDPGFTSGYWTFNGTTTMMTWPDSADWDTPAGDGSTRIIVARWPSAQPAFTRLLDSYGGGWWNELYVSTNGINFRFNGNAGADVITTVAGASGSTWQVITGRVDATQQWVRNNGVNGATSARPVGANTPTGSLVVGRFVSSGAWWLTGDVKLVAIWNRALSDAEVMAIEAAYG